MRKEVTSYNPLCFIFLLPEFMEIANSAAAIMLLSCAGDEIGEKGQFCPGIISVTTGTKARRIASADNDASAVGGPTFVQFFKNTIVVLPLSKNDNPSKNEGLAFLRTYL